MSIAGLNANRRRVSGTTQNLPWGTSPGSLGAAGSEPGPPARHPQGGGGPCAPRPAPALRVTTNAPGRLQCEPQIRSRMGLGSNASSAIDWLCGQGSCMTTLSLSVLICQMGINNNTSFQENCEAPRSWQVLGRCPARLKCGGRLAVIIPCSFLKCRIILACAHPSQRL